MAELHIYRGLQGSGKSTLAAANAEKDGGRVVGRDKIRALMGFEGIGKLAQEHEVTKLQGLLIADGLRTGQNVHVDDMNLKSAYVARLISIGEKFDARVVVHDLTDVPLATCLSRNYERSEKNKGSGFVDESVITSNWTKFIKGKDYPLPVPRTPKADMRLEPPARYVPDRSKPWAFLVDLDGTVALKNPGRGYHDYDARVYSDFPNEPVIAVVEALETRGMTPLFVSGRKSTSACVTATRAWIEKHVTDRDFHLYMREPHDNRPDWIVKEELFNSFSADWYIRLALDDRDQVVQRYRQMGLTVLQVADGNF